MAFVLDFSTRPHNQGKSIILYDTSSDWLSFAETPTKTVVEISVVNNYVQLLNGGTPVSTITKEFAGTIAQGFEYEITAEDLGFGTSSTIPDAIYVFAIKLFDGVIEITTEGYSKTNKEVSYYNSEKLKNTKFVTLAQKDDCDIVGKESQEALYLSSKIEGIFASAIYGDTGAIYNSFDNLKRKYPNDVI